MSTLVSSSFGGGHSLPPQLAAAGLADPSLLLSKCIAHPTANDDWLRVYLGNGTEFYSSSFGADIDENGNNRKSQSGGGGGGGGYTSSASQASVSMVSTNHPLASLQSLPDKMKLSVLTAYRQKRNTACKWLPVILNRFHGGPRGGKARDGSGGGSGGDANNSSGMFGGVSDDFGGLSAGGHHSGGGSGVGGDGCKPMNLGLKGLVVPTPPPFQNGKAGSATRQSFADLFALGGGGSKYLGADDGVVGKNAFENLHQQQMERLAFNAVASKVPLPRPSLLAPPGTHDLVAECSHFSSLAILYAEMYYHDQDNTGEFGSPRKPTATAGYAGVGKRRGSDVGLTPSASNGTAPPLSGDSNDSNNTLSLSEKYFWSDEQTIVIVTADAIYVFGGYGETIEPSEEEKLACEVAMKSSPLFINESAKKESQNKNGGGAQATNDSDDDSDNGGAQQQLTCFENRRFTEAYYLRRCIPIAAVTDFSKSSVSNVVNVVCNNHNASAPHHHRTAGTASAAAAGKNASASTMTEDGRFFDVALPAISDPTEYQHTDEGQDDPDVVVSVGDADVLLEALAGAKKISRWKTEIAKFYDEHTSVITHFEQQLAAAENGGDDAGGMMNGASGDASGLKRSISNVSGSRISNAANAASTAKVAWEQTVKKANLFTQRLRTRLATQYAPLVGASPNGDATFNAIVPPSSSSVSSVTASNIGGGVGGGGLSADATAVEVYNAYTNRQLRVSVNGPNLSDIPYRSHYHVEASSLLLPTPPPAASTTIGGSSAVFDASVDFTPEALLPLATMNDLASTAMAVKVCRDLTLTQLNIAMAAQNGLAFSTSATTSVGAGGAVNNNAVSTVSNAGPSPLSSPTAASAGGVGAISIEETLREIVLLKENVKRLEAENKIIKSAGGGGGGSISTSIGGFGGGGGSGGVDPTAAAETAAMNRRLQFDLDNAKKLVVDLQKKLKKSEAQLDASRDETALLKKELDSAVKNIEKQNNAVRNFIETYVSFVESHWADALKYFVQYRSQFEKSTADMVKMYLTTPSAISGVVSVAYANVLSTMESSVATAVKTVVRRNRASSVHSRSVSPAELSENNGDSGIGAENTVFDLKSLPDHINGVPIAEIAADAADRLTNKIIASKEANESFTHLLTSLEKCRDVLSEIQENGAKLMLITVKQKQVPIPGLSALGGGEGETNPNNNDLNTSGAGGSNLNSPNTATQTAFIQRDFDGRSATVQQHVYTRTRFKIGELEKAAADESPAAIGSPTKNSRSRGYSVYSSGSGAGGSAPYNPSSASRPVAAPTPKMISTGILNFNEVSSDQALLELKQQYLTLRDSLGHASTLIMDVNQMNCEAPSKELLARSTIHIILQRFSHIVIRLRTFDQWIAFHFKKKSMRLEAELAEAKKNVQTLQVQVEKEVVSVQTKSVENEENLRRAERLVKEKEEELKLASQRIADMEQSHAETAALLQKEKLRAENALETEKKAAEKLTQAGSEASEASDKCRQLERERDSLKAKIARMEDLHEEKRELDAFEEQLKQLTAENEELRAQWQHEHNEFQKLQQEKDSLFEVHTDLQQEMTARSLIESKLEEQLRLVTANREAIASQLTTAARDLQASKHALELATKRANDLDEQLTSAIGNFQDIRKRSMIERVDAIRLELDFTKTYANLLNDEHNDYMHTIVIPASRAMNHILTAALRNRAVNDHISEARTRTMQEQFANVESALSEAASRIDSLENALALQQKQATQDVEEYKHKLRVSFSDAEKLRVDSELSERKCLALQKRVEELEKELTESIEAQKKSLKALHAIDMEVLEKQMHNQQLDVERYKAETEETLADLDASLQREKLLRSDLEHKTQELAAAFEVVKDLEKEMESQGKQLAEMTLMYNNLRKAIADEYEKIAKEKASMLEEVEKARQAVEDERRRLNARVFADAATEVDEQIMDPESQRYETRIIDLQDDIRGLTHDLHVSAARENVLFNENTTLKRDLSEAKNALEEAIEQMLEAEEDRSFMQVQIEKENIALAEKGEWADLMRKFVFERREKELLEEAESYRNINAQLEEHIRGLVDETTLMTDDLLQNKAQHDADLAKLKTATETISALEEKMLLFDDYKAAAETVPSLKEQWLNEKIALKTCREEKAEVERLLEHEKKEMGDHIMNLQEELVKLETEEDEGKKHMREELDLLRRQIASTSTQHQIQTGVYEREIGKYRKEISKLTRANKLMTAVLRDYEISEDEYAVEEDEEETSSSAGSGSDEDGEKHSSPSSRADSRRRNRRRRRHRSRKDGSDSDGESSSSSTTERRSTTVATTLSETGDEYYYRTGTDLTGTTNTTTNRNNKHKDPSTTQYLRTRAKIAVIEAKGKSHKFLRSALMAIHLDRIVQWMRQWEEMLFVGGGGGGGGFGESATTKSLANRQDQRRSHSYEVSDYSDPDDDRAPAPLLFQYLSQRDSLILDSCRALIQQSEERILSTCLQREQALQRSFFSHFESVFDMFDESSHELQNITTETTAIAHANELAKLAAENYRLEDELSAVTEEMMKHSDANSNTVKALQSSAAKQAMQALHLIETCAVDEKYTLARQESEARRLILGWSVTASMLATRKNSAEQSRLREEFFQRREQEQERSFQEKMNEMLLKNEQLTLENEALKLKCRTPSHSPPQHAHTDEEDNDAADQNAATTPLKNDNKDTNNNEDEQLRIEQMLQEEDRIRSRRVLELIEQQRREEHEASIERLRRLEEEAEAEAAALQAEEEERQRQILLMQQQQQQEEDETAAMLQEMRARSGSPRNFGVGRNGIDQTLHDTVVNSDPTPYLLFAPTANGLLDRQQLQQLLLHMSNERGKAIRISETAAQIGDAMRASFLEAEAKRLFLQSGQLAVSAASAARAREQHAILSNNNDMNSDGLAPPTNAPTAAYYRSISQQSQQQQQQALLPPHTAIIAAGGGGGSGSGQGLNRSSGVASRATSPNPFHRMTSAHNSSLAATPYSRVPTGGENSNSQHQYTNAQQLEAVAASVAAYSRMASATSMLQQQQQQTTTPAAQQQQRQPQLAVHPQNRLPLAPTPATRLLQPRPTAATAASTMVGGNGEDYSPIGVGRAISPEQMRLAHKIAEVVFNEQQQQQSITESNNASYAAATPLLYQPPPQASAPASLSSSPSLRHNTTYSSGVGGAHSKGGVGGGGGNNNSSTRLSYY